MTTPGTSNSSPPRRASVLHSLLVGPAGVPRRHSPEAFRQSIMLMIALVGAGIAGYFLFATQGTGSTRQVLAVIFAGWLAMSVHIVRSTPKSPDGKK